MKAGAAAADITPKPGIELAGYAARVQPSTSVNDPLRMRCLFLEHDGIRLCWIHADLIGFGRDLVHRIREELKTSCGLLPHEIVLSASHTHAGPPTIELLGCGKLNDQGYLRHLGFQAAGAAISAIRQAVDVEVWEGTATCGIALDRRHQERAPRQDEVVVLGFRDVKLGRHVAVLANYAIHPVSLNYKNRAISADLTGAAANALEGSGAIFGPVLVTNGACGDLNPPVQGDDYRETEGLGISLSEAILKAIEASQRVAPSLSSRLLTSKVAVEPMDEVAVRIRAERVRHDQTGKDPVWAASSLQAADEWERRMLAQLPLQPMELPIQELLIGSRRIYCFGAEVLSKMSEDLKAVFGPRTTVVGYANGDIGYLCPEEAHDEGGYEPDLAFIYYGTPKIARGAFEEVVRSLRDGTADIEQKSPPAD